MLLLQQKKKSASLKKQESQDEQTAKFLVRQALEQDEQGNESEALELYLQAAELCLKAQAQALPYTPCSKVTTGRSI